MEHTICNKIWSIFSLDIKKIFQNCYLKKYPLSTQLIKKKYGNKEKTKMIFKIKYYTNITVLRTPNSLPVQKKSLYMKDELEKRT